MNGPITPGRIYAVSWLYSCEDKGIAGYFYECKGYRRNAQQYFVTFSTSFSSSSDISTLRSIKKQDKMSRMLFEKWICNYFLL